ncbi:hypothetical protein BJ742DRAFT_715196 [Cladochytrium replicatum]|nr:hypothetical protein BJ742DRAFT_715196 [Cladochytrium replicatum]
MHVEVLEWWKNSGTELRRTSDGLDQAMSRRYILALQLSPLHSAPLPKKRKQAIDMACGDMIDRLNWWRESGPTLHWTEKALDNSSCQDMADVSDWLAGSGLTFCWSTDAMDGASANGNTAVLEWWVKSGLQLRYPSKAIDHACVRWLEWWEKWAAFYVDRPSDGSCNGTPKH